MKKQKKNKMARFRIIERQVVEHTYTWEVEAASEEEALELTHDGVPDNATESTSMSSSDTEIDCLHANQYVNDRNLFVCKDCDEELGR